ncbi:MAG: glycosyltransferase, partial [Candidatus Hadarchaeum sp.]
VVEALARGLPAVVTPGVASHIYVDASGCGQTVEDSLEALAWGIEKVLLADRQTLGRAGRAFVESNLTWSAVCNRLIALYDQVCKNENKDSF